MVFINEDIIDACLNILGGGPLTTDCIWGSKKFENPLFKLLKTRSTTIMHDIAKKLYD